jgi:hypothetical protein
MDLNPPHLLVAHSPPETIFPGSFSGEPLASMLPIKYAVEDNLIAPDIPDEPSWEHSGPRMATVDPAIGLGPPGLGCYR